MSAVAEVIPLAREEDIVTARQRAREISRELGFGAVDQSRIATAVSELARNVLRYAHGAPGDVRIRALNEPSPERVGVEVVVHDEGPGIPDVHAALRDGYTSGGGLGLGLPGARRLMDELTIDTAIGRGTTVTIRKWRR
jgi:serine/threonine-protein kinase RsbT